MTRLPVFAHCATERVVFGVGHKHGVCSLQWVRMLGSFSETDMYTQKPERLSKNKQVYPRMVHGKIALLGLGSGDRSSSLALQLLLGTRLQGLGTIPNCHLPPG